MSALELEEKEISTVHSKERALWSAVILQALEDATLPIGT